MSDERRFVTAFLIKSDGTKITVPQTENVVRRGKSVIVTHINPWTHSSSITEYFDIEEYYVA